MSRLWTTRLPWKPLYSQLSPNFLPQGGGNEEENDSWVLTFALATTVAFVAAMYLFESLLDLRQRACYLETEFPKELQVTVSRFDEAAALEDKKKEAKEEEETKAKDEKQGKSKEETKTKEEEKDDDKAETVKKDEPLLPQLQNKFAKAQAYGMDKVNFSIVSSTYGIVESVVLLLVGFLPWAWDVSVAMGQTYLGWSSEADKEIQITLIFMALTTLVDMVTSLPFELYSTFYIEKKHGFNKQTLGLFVSDKIKSLLLTFLIGGPFISLLLSIIKWGGDLFYLYVWAFMFVFSIFMMTIVPVFIMPLFNKYEPLEDGDLRTKIYQLAGSLDFPLTKLFVMDGSKRSAHSNAFMFGFFNNKRIVLFDTLLQQVSTDEVLAILGHELGHWKLGHTLTNFVVTQVYFGAAFYLFSLCYTCTDLYSAFGFDDPTRRPVPTIIALLLFFQTVWAPLDKLLSLGVTVHSRHCEFAADAFAVQLGWNAALQSGLCKIHLENLGAMCPDSWYSTYHYSHPPLVERLSAMMQLDKKSK